MLSMETGPIVNFTVHTEICKRAKEISKTLPHRENWYGWLQRSLHRPPKTECVLKNMPSPMVSSAKWQRAHNCKASASLPSAILSSNLQEVCQF